LAFNLFSVFKHYIDYNLTESYKTNQRGRNREKIRKKEGAIERKGESRKSEKEIRSIQKKLSYADQFSKSSIR